MRLSTPAPCRLSEKAEFVNILVILVPVALALGLAGLGAFMWSMRNGQYDDAEGAAHRILSDDDVSR